MERTKPKRESVLVPFIPAIQLMRDGNISYKDILRFIHDQGTQCSYSTLITFVNAYMGKKTSAKQKRLATLSCVDAGDGAAGGSSALAKTAQPATRRPDGSAGAAEKAELAKKVEASRLRSKGIIGKSAEELINQAINL